MKVCESCGRRLELGKFSRNAGSCRSCRAEAERGRRREARAERLEELDEEERERFEAWRVRTLAGWEATNERRRRFGWPELPPPDVEPGWFERLQARAQEKMRLTQVKVSRRRAD